MVIKTVNELFFYWASGVTACNLNCILSSLGNWNSFFWHEEKSNWKSSLEHITSGKSGTFFLASTSICS